MFAYKQLFYIHTIFLAAHLCLPSAELYGMQDPLAFLKRCGGTNAHRLLFQRPPQFFEELVKIKSDEVALHKLQGIVNNIVAKEKNSSDQDTRNYDSLLELYKKIEAHVAQAPEIVKHLKGIAQPNFCIKEQQQKVFNILIQELSPLAEHIKEEDIDTFNYQHEETALPLLGTYLKGVLLLESMKQSGLALISKLARKLEDSELKNLDSFAMLEACAYNRQQYNTSEKWQRPDDTGNIIESCVIHVEHRAMSTLEDMARQKYPETYYFIKSNLTEYIQQIGKNFAENLKKEPRYKEAFVQFNKKLSSTLHFFAQKSVRPEEKLAKLKDITAQALSSIPSLEQYQADGVCKKDFKPHVEKLLLRYYEVAHLLYMFYIEKADPLEDACTGKSLEEIRVFSKNLEKTKEGRLLMKKADESRYINLVYQGHLLELFGPQLERIANIEPIKKECGNEKLYFSQPLHDTYCDHKIVSGFLKWCAEKENCILKSESWTAPQQKKLEEELQKELNMRYALADKLISEDSFFSIHTKKMLQERQASLCALTSKVIAPQKSSKH